MTKPLRVVTLLATAVLTVALPAQLRRPCFGTVVDGDDRPIVSAEVILVWTPDKRGLGEPDVVRATTDERGRFKADVVVGRAYSAWAIGSAAPDGSRLVSEVTDRAAAGVVLQLPAWHRWRPRRLNVDGHKRWIGDKPLLLTLLPDGRNVLMIDLSPGNGQGFELPPTPWCDSAVALLDARRCMVRVGSFPPEIAAPKVVFKPATEFEIEVVDENGKPVTGATVEQKLTVLGQGGDSILRPRGRFEWRKTAATDTNGRARILDPVGAHDWLRVGAPGTTWTYAPAEVTRAPAVVQLRIVKANLTPGRVSGLRDDEIAFGELSTAVSYRSGRTNNLLYVELPVRVMEDGRLALDRAPADAQDSALVLHLLPRSNGTPRYVVAAPSRDPSRRLPDVDLSAMRSWRIRAFDGENNPLPGAEVLVFSQPDRPRCRPDGIHFVLDHAGRADLVLDSGEWCVYVTNGSAHAIRFLEADDEGNSELKLKLEPIPTLRCRVIDAKGQPVRGARVKQHGTMGMSGRSKKGEDRAKEAVAAMMAMRSATVARSSRDGMLVLPVQDWMKMRANILVRAGALTSEPFPLVAADEILEVVVR